MHIAIDATVVRAPLSGVNYAVRAQTLALITELTDAKLLILASDPVLQQAAHKAGCECRGTSPLLQNPMHRICWQQLVLPGILKRYKMDLLVAPAYTMPLTLSIPAILEVHDTIGLDHPELCRRRNAWHARGLYRRSMNRATEIIVSSDSVAERVIACSRHNEGSIHKVPLALDDVFRGPTPPLPDRLAEFQPYILFVGNIEPKKDMDTLIDAFSQMSGTHNLIIAGQDGWKCRKTVARIAAYAGPGRIQRLGYVPRDQLPELYAHAAAAVLPSIVEGFGLPLIEALAMGTPIVHSDHPALLEVAAGYGHSFPIGDADSLANALKYATSSRLTTDAIAHARTRTWQDWAKSVHRIILAYSS